MTGIELIEAAEYIIHHAVGRDEIDDFANAVIEYLKKDGQPESICCADCQSTDWGAEDGDITVIGVVKAKGGVNE